MQNSVTVYSDTYSSPKNPTIRPVIKSAISEKLSYFIQNTRVYRFFCHLVLAIL